MHIVWCKYPDESRPDVGFGVTEVGFGKRGPGHPSAKINTVVSISMISAAIARVNSHVAQYPAITHPKLIFIISPDWKPKT